MRFRRRRIAVYLLFMSGCSSLELGNLINFGSLGDPVGAFALDSESCIKKVTRKNGQVSITVEVLSLQEKSRIITSTIDGLNSFSSREKQGIKSCVSRHLKALMRTLRESKRSKQGDLYRGSILIEGTLYPEAEGIFSNELGNAKGQFGRNSG